MLLVLSFDTWPKDDEDEGDDDDYDDGDEEKEGGGSRGWGGAWGRASLEQELSVDWLDSKSRP